MVSRPRPRRRGATLVEFAVVAPFLFFYLIGLIVLGLGVYRYQQVAFLAREGARYASTHGAEYRVDSGMTAGDSTAWTQEIRTNAVLPLASELRADRLSVTASWSAGHNRANAVDPTSAPPFQKTVPNVVTVTVSYQWVAEGFFTSPITLTSTASMPMSY